MSKSCWLRRNSALALILRICNWSGGCYGRLPLFLFRDGARLAIRAPGVHSRRCSFALAFARGNHVLRWLCQLVEHTRQNDGGFVDYARQTGIFCNLLSGRTLASGFVCGFSEGHFCLVCDYRRYLCGGRFFEFVRSGLASGFALGFVLVSALRLRAAFLGFSRLAFKCRTIHPRNRTGRRCAARRFPR